MPMMKGWLDRVRVDNRQKGLSGRNVLLPNGMEAVFIAHMTVEPI